MPGITLPGTSVICRLSYLFFSEDDRAGDFVFLCEGDSPLERGFKGCVTVRSAVGVEIILLLFGGVVFFSFRWLFLI